MGASVRPGQDIDALIAERRKALAAAPPQDVDALIASRRAAMASPASGEVAPAAPRATPQRVRVPGQDGPASMSTDTTPGLGHSLTQGMTLGFGDEIEAATRWLDERIGAHFGSKVTPRSYAEHRDELRAQLEAERTAHPIGSVAAEMAGAVAPALLTGGGSAAGTAAAEARGVLPAAGRVAIRGAKAAATGAGFGAIAGAGSADGDLSDRAAGAVRGAKIGATTGAVLSGASDVVGGVARRVGGKVVDALNVRPVTTEPPVNSAAVEGLGTRAARRIGVRSSDDRAQEIVLDALGKDGMSVADARAAAAALPDDKPAMLMDVAGTNTQRLARGARNVANAESANRIPAALEARQGGQIARVASDVQRASGVERPDIHMLAQSLAEQRQQEASGLYEKAFAHGAVPDPVIEKMLKLPYFDKAWAQAERLAKLDGRRMPRIFEEHVAKGTLPPNPNPSHFSDEQWADFARKAGAVAPDVVTQVEKVVPDVEALHLVKLGLDDVVQDKLRAPLDRGGLSQTQAAKVIARQKEFLQTLDQHVPAYGEARARYAQASQMMEALDDGKSAATRLKDPRAIALELSTKYGDSPDAHRLYRAGMLDALHGDLEQTADNRNVLSRVNANDWQRARLRLIAESEPKAQELSDRLGVEGRMSDTRRFVTGNSTTAGQQQDIANVTGDTKASDFSLRHPLRALLSHAAKSEIVDRLRQVNAQNADAIGKRLLAGSAGRKELLEALDALDAAQRRGPTGGRTLPRIRTRAAAALSAGEAIPHK